MWTPTAAAILLGGVSQVPSRWHGSIGLSIGLGMPIVELHKSQRHVLRACDRAIEIMVF